MKREAPARRGPIRNRALNIPAESPGVSRGGYTVGAMVDESVRTAMRAVEAADATVRGAVERGVDTAYMVIEEYMLRGRQAAGRNHQRRNGGKDMNDDRQNGGGFGGNGFGAGPWSAINPLMAPWMQMMRMWTDSMAALMPGGTGAAATDWMNQFIPGAAAWSAARPAVAVHVTSENPVEVSASVDAGAEYATLSVAALQHSSGNGTSITGITAECTPSRIRLVVDVPKGQATGHYSGHIIDSSGANRGLVQLEVHPRRGGDAPAAASKGTRKGTRKAARKRTRATGK